jgi:indole-3-glycerol phosphate synthase
MNILDQIIETKKAEVNLRKDKFPLRDLEKRRYFKRQPLSMTASVLDPDKTGIIAEFKKKSPSRGLINDKDTVEEVTTGYFRSGASALSVLTDADYFGGSDSDLTRTRELNPIPILRKDFTIDEYQVVEAKSLGADAILLIAAVLSPRRVEELARTAHDLGLQVLLEVHAAEELDRCCGYIDMVGVNNRDLTTFLVDTELSMRLISEIPEGLVRVSESGISSPIVVKQLRSAGYQGFLIGENFMRAPDPVVAFSDFVKLILGEA